MKEKKNSRPLCAMVVLLMALSFAMEVNARSWRVNSNTNRKAHFVDINAAMASSEVLAGDTLYLDPGTIITTTQDVTKQVTIVGTGYPMNGIIIPAEISGTLNFKSAAVGAKMEGVKVTSTDIYIDAANVIVERCWVKNFCIRAKNVTLRQCRGYHFYGQGSTNTSSSGCVIENCLLFTSSARNIYDLYNATIRNNYMHTSRNGDNLSDIGNSTIINNLIINSNNKNRMFTTSNLGGCIIQNNVLSCDEGTYPSYPNNVCLGSNNLITFPTGSTTDEDFELIKSIEQLQGAAINGGDCGPFGGFYPYVCSGYPLGMPHFISSVVSPRPQNGQVSINQQVTVQKR